MCDFDKHMKYYTQNFNLIPSNVLYIPAPGSSEQKYVAMFAYIDRGDELVDHHTIFLTTLPPNKIVPHVHYCSFEVHDFDTPAKGYELAWGLGRHLLGSQLRLLVGYW